MELARALAIAAEMKAQAMRRSTGTASRGRQADVPDLRSHVAETEPGHCDGTNFAVLASTRARLMRAIAMLK